MAICRATSSGPVKLRLTAESVGRMFQFMAFTLRRVQWSPRHQMDRGSLDLEIPCGRQSPDAPRRIQTRDDGRNDCQHDRPDDAHRIEMRQRLGNGVPGLRVERTYAVETEEGESESEQRP